MSDLYARFVGGPWHNRHLLVKARERHAVHVGVDPGAGSGLKTSHEKFVYHKTLVCLPSGARSYEYVSEGLSLATSAGVLMTGGNGKIDRADWLRQRWASKISRPDDKVRG